LLSITIFLAFNHVLYGQIVPVPHDTLYNQTLTPSGDLKVSTHFFEIGYETTYSCEAADDFVCDDQWTITNVFALGGFYNGSVNPQTFHVVIYGDDNPNGDFPGTELYNYHHTVDTMGTNGFTIPIEDEVVLPAGHYWISVYANTELGNAQWGWKPSSGPYNYEAVWENPGDGFGTGYTYWTPITTVWQGTTETDFSFALFGINGIPASNPDPADGELAVELDKDISWSNPADAVSVEVFWGTDPNNLTSIYSGSPITSFEQGQMDYNNEYYWRVDVNDGDGVATGNTWYFSTMQDPAIVLNEDFDDNGFPPGGWTFENSDENLWSKYYGISAYGEGVNSARAKFFLSLISDSVSSMITHTFYPLNAGDTLAFDYAYAATSMYFIDSLEILFSTDSGQNWESLVLLHGGPNGELVTAPHSTSEFVPDPNQWETMKLTLPQGVTKFKFKAMSAGGNDLFLDNIRIINQSGTPVELVSFNAVVLNNDVHLKWTTETETNNSGFEIQRKQFNKDWENTGFIEGHGSTTKEHNYSFTDKNVLPGDYQYKLKQIDYDGSFEYSDIVDVKISGPTEFSLEQNYPNPFNPSTTIKYTIPESGNVKLKVYDSLGEEVATLVDEFKDSGSYDIEFSANGLSSGIYFYRLKTNNYDQIKKMILLK
ncbi:MAG: T9SS type A sorting domain-containing protein, partial [Ignavibacteriaceae bacterium]|nr:T9SS type A sorting domain-containing protein [Ignavibacteriaceae bacterium]